MATKMGVGFEVLVVSDFQIQFFVYPPFAIRGNPPTPTHPKRAPKKKKKPPAARRRCRWFRVSESASFQAIPGAAGFSLKFDNQKRWFQSLGCTLHSGDRQGCIPIPTYPLWEIPILAIYSGYLWIIIPKNPHKTQ